MSGPIAALTIPATVSWARFSPTGEQVVSFDAQGMLTLWDLATGTQRARQPLDGVHRIQLSDTGQHILTLHSDGQRRCWCARCGRCPRRLRRRRGKGLGRIPRLHRRG